jgi:hypothetical protein
MRDQAWSFAEDAVLFEEYLSGMGWESRASQRLPGRSTGAISGHAGELHLRTSAWMRDEMTREGWLTGSTFPHLTRKGRLARGLPRTASNGLVQTPCQNVLPVNQMRASESEGVE